MNAVGGEGMNTIHTRTPSTCNLRGGQFQNVGSECEPLQMRPARVAANFVGAYGPESRIWTLFRNALVGEFGGTG
jgi:hypothetical protein